MKAIRRTLASLGLLMLAIVHLAGCRAPVEAPYDSTQLSSPPPPHSETCLLTRYPGIEQIYIPQWGHILTSSENDGFLSMYPRARTSSTECSNRTHRSLRRMYPQSGCAVQTVSRIFSGSSRRYKYEAGWIQTVCLFFKCLPFGPFRFRSAKSDQT